MKNKYLEIFVNIIRVVFEDLKVVMNVFLCLIFKPYQSVAKDRVGYVYLKLFNILPASVRDLDKYI